MGSKTGGVIGGVVGLLGGTVAGVVGAVGMVVGGNLLFNFALVLPKIPSSQIGSS